jgi:beta-propeller repeat-containing protein
MKNSTILAKNPAAVMLTLAALISSMLLPAIPSRSAFASAAQKRSTPVTNVQSQVGPGTSDNAGYGPLSDPPNVTSELKTGTPNVPPEILERSGNLEPSGIKDASGAGKRGQPDLDTLLARLPIHFVENRGQANAAVRFEVNANHHKVFFASNEVVFAAAPEVNGKRRPEAIRLRFDGASPSPAIAGTELLPGKFNYFVGNDPSKWETDVPSYRGVAYKGLYKGVDLIFKDAHGQIERDFVISPGVDPGIIQMSYQGAKRIRLSKEGELVVETRWSVLTEARPEAFQNIDGKTVKVATNFKIAKGNGVAFEVGDYDRSQPLIIDPVFRFSTFVGGSGDDRALGVAVDATGVYAVGETPSLGFPTSGIFGPLAGTDQFALKLTADGSMLVYSDIIGGAALDRAFACQVHPSDNSLYVLGVTGSANFPTTVGSFDTTFNGGVLDYNVTRINAAGNGFIWSTYIGGGGDEASLGGIDVYNNGDCWIVGGTSSRGPSQGPNPYPVATTFGTNLSPTNAGGAGSFDGVATAIRSTGNQVVTSGFWGGGNSQGSGVAINKSSLDFYFCGVTFSATTPVCTGVGVPFPSCQSAGFDTTHNIGRDGYITRFTNVGNPIGSTYLGDPIALSADNRLFGISFDGSTPPNVYVAGSTSGPGYPTTPGAFQTTYNGGTFDQVVTRLTPTLSALGYSTFIGGLGEDEAFGIAVDGAGNAYITGKTSSANFPVTPQFPTSVFKGIFDATFTKLNPAGSALLLSSYIGGSGSDRGNAIRLNAGGTLATIAGTTSSVDFPTTPGAFDTSYNGGDDAFVTQVNPGLFDVCIQDDSNGSFLMFNSTSGEYQFTNCAGVTITGVGTLRRRGDQITLEHNAGDRRVVASIDSAVNKGSAAIQSFSQGRTFTITDRNTANNTCNCP